MDFSQIIELFAKDHDYDATIVCEEYKRFLYLRSKTPELSPSDMVDDFWHIHILCTEHYRRYCYVTFDKFIHHNLYDSIINTPEVRTQRIINTISEYKKVFTTIDTNVWPQAHKLLSTNKSRNKDELEHIRAMISFKRACDYASSNDRVFSCHAKC